MRATSARFAYDFTDASAASATLSGILRRPRVAPDRPDICRTFRRTKHASGTPHRLRRTVRRRGHAVHRRARKLKVDPAVTTQPRYAAREIREHCFDAP